MLGIEELQATLKEHLEWESKHRFDVMDHSTPTVIFDLYDQMIAMAQIIAEQNERIQRLESALQSVGKALGAVQAVDEAGIK